MKVAAPDLGSKYKGYKSTATQTQKVREQNAIRKLQADLNLIDVQKRVVVDALNQEIHQ